MSGLVDGSAPPDPVAGNAAGGTLNHCNETRILDKFASVTFRSAEKSRFVKLGVSCLAF
jgi:hypothetical protein